MGPEDVIKPLPASWLSLGGDSFLGCFSPRVTDGFLEGRSSFLSFFLLGTPFSATLGANKDASSFPFCFFPSSFLRSTADAFTNALYLAASISVKEKGWEVKHKNNREESKLHKEGKTYDGGSIRSTYEL